MKILLCVIFLLFAVPAMAQVNINLAWDASPTQSLPENPVNYRLYNCSDAALTVCSKVEVGTGLTYGAIALAHGSTTYFYVTAWNLSSTSETGGTTTGGQEQESEPSNVLKVRAFAPPGNPKNNRVIISDMGGSGSGSGQLLAYLQ